MEWIRGNLINFYARLGDAEKALNNLYGLIQENASSSLLTYSRGGIAGAQQDIFAMDGNISGASGISEMLVQSYHDTVFLLPSLPTSWHSGSFNGVCTRNGFEVNLKWGNGELEKVEVFSKKGNTCRIECQGKSIAFETKKGVTYRLDKNLNLISH